MSTIKSTDPRSLLPQVPARQQAFSLINKAIVKLPEKHANFIAQKSGDAMALSNIIPNTKRDIRITIPLKGNSTSQNGQSITVEKASNVRRKGQVNYSQRLSGIPANIHGRAIHGSTSAQKPAKKNGPITFARDIMGLKSSPTILLQTLRSDGFALPVDDASVHLEPMYALSDNLKDCNINVQRNEAITCTSTYLSAETLIPFVQKVKEEQVSGLATSEKPKTKRKRRKTTDDMESSDEEGVVVVKESNKNNVGVIAIESDSGGVSEPEERSFQSTAKRLKLDSEYVKKNSDNAQNENNASSEQNKMDKLAVNHYPNDNVSDSSLILIENSEIKIEDIEIVDSTEGSKTLGNDKKDDLFAGCSGVKDGEIMVEEVKLDELLELNEMIEEDSEELVDEVKEIKEEMDSDADGEVWRTDGDQGAWPKTDNERNVTENFLKDYSESNDKNECLERNYVVMDTAERTVKGRTIVDASIEDSSESNKNKLDRSAVNIDAGGKVVNCEEGTDVLQNCLNVAGETLKEGEHDSNGKKNDVGNSVKKNLNESEDGNDSSKNMKEKNKESKDDTVSSDEEFAGSSWLNDYIEEFEEENETKIAGDVGAEVEIDEEEYDIFKLQQYLAYLGVLDYEFEMSDAKKCLMCEKCGRLCVKVETLYQHISEKVSCLDLYVMAWQATFSNDPAMKRNGGEGEEEYVEAYGCYMCGYMSYDPGEVRHHWLKEHMNDAAYVCRYCFAEFHTSFRAALHVLLHHRDSPLQIGMVRSPMYQRAIILDFEDIRNKLYCQMAIYEDPITVEEQRLRRINTKFSSQQHLHNCLLKCKFCSLESDHADSLRAHLNVCHPALLRSFACTLCRQTFRGQFDLRRHVAIAHCKLIGTGKSFMDYSFKRCQKLLQRPLYYKEVSRHKRKQYVCTQCLHDGMPQMQSFASKEQMVEHYGKEHTNLKSLRCDKCNLPYATNGWCTGRCGRQVDVVLECFLDAIGLRTSAPRNLNLLVCSVCCYKGHDKSSLFAHIKNAHTLCKPYTCPRCSYTAMEHSRMSKHKANIHNLLPDEEEETVTDRNGNKQVRHYNYKAILDAVADSLVLSLPARDREICLFEGDTMLNKVLPAKDEPSITKKLLAERPEYKETINTVRPPPPAPSSAVAKISTVKPDDDPATAPAKKTIMRPCIVEKSLFLDIEEPIAQTMPRSDLKLLLDSLKKEPTDNVPAEKDSMLGFLMGGTIEAVDESELNAQLFLEDAKPKKTSPLYKRPGTKAWVGSGTNFKCHWCGFDTNKHSKLLSHLRDVHNTQQMGNQGRYWQCSLCGYCAKDRSCIGRHVKYIHMTRRPHSCYYCDYNSIEKTKVRLHVACAHKDEPCVVRTDETLSLLMSQAVKKYIYFVDGDDMCLETTRTGQPEPYSLDSMSKLSVSSRLKINTIDYIPPSADQLSTSAAPPSPKRRKVESSTTPPRPPATTPSSSSDPSDDAVQWAVYQVDADQWIDIEPAPEAPPIRRRLTPRYRNDKKLLGTMEPKVKLKDVMKWMVKWLEKEYGFE